VSCAKKGILHKGEVGVGDPIQLIEEGKDRVRVRDITQLYAREKYNTGLLQRAITAEALPESWKSYFRHRLDKLRS
jgi:MOSC domain-containing protein YiiM